MAVEMKVTNWSPRPRHGGSFPHYSLVLDLDTGEQYETFGRAFECPCGEPLMDGDPCLSDKIGPLPIHANCAHLA